jgi:hypothetical protein
VTLTYLKNFLNANYQGRNSHQAYRWFFATKTTKDLPVGRGGAFIVMPFVLRECHKGWYLVATTATHSELKAWKHFSDCVSISVNKDFAGIRVSGIERKLGRDPRKWLEVMSSKNPEDWIYQHGSGIGRTNKPGAGRPKKSVDKSTV